MNEGTQKKSPQIFGKFGNPTMRTKYDPACHSLSLSLLSDTKKKVKKKVSQMLFLDQTHLFAELVVMALEVYIVDKDRDRSMVQCKLCSNIATGPVGQ